MSNAEGAICLISDYDDQSHTLIGARRGQEDYERSRAWVPNRSWWTWLAQTTFYKQGITPSTNKLGSLSPPTFHS